MDSNINFAVETRALVKKYGSLPAVNGLDLSIERGETYGLLGPNGSGKTTAIKLFCGLLKPTGGESFTLGKKAGDPSILHKLGYMPQETALYLDLTVHENLALFGAIYGMNRADIEQEEKSLLRFIDLEDRRNSTINSLSGGMRHRVSLACSLIHRPELLFLDEPTVGVDPELRASFWDYFASLRQRGVTVVITTHYMDEAFKCSKIGLMRLGRIIAEGAPTEIIRAAGTSSLEEAFLKIARRGQQ